MSYPKPVLEPAAEQFVRESALPPYPYQLGVEDGRKALEAAQSGNVPRPAADVTDLEITGGPTGRVVIRIVRPPARPREEPQQRRREEPPGRLREEPATMPAVVYVHGGGWVFGGVQTHDRLVRELAVAADAAIVFVNYTPAPEARYPIAIEEIYAVLEWIAVHGAGYGLDPCRIAIAGDSVGGTMTAAVTIMAKQRSGPTLAGQVLFYPVTDAAFGTDSYHQFAEGYGLRREAMPWFWDQYAPDVPVRAEITASPLRATTEQLAGLPPALLVVAEADVLRDEGEAYAASLRAAGVPVTGVRYQGIIHDFVMLDALRDTHAARAAIAQAGTFLQDALG
ncbi:alpha/beta hydrolase [Actinoplanes sp. NPDC051851]|uniref:alpha/beta hydrolase n=1 Tax=Actinoplanes sp. NPDC051851 TaxID=3154753 RepID=UPI0034382A3B